jgi:hypothetical protein
MAKPKKYKPVGMLRLPEQAEADLNEQAKIEGKKPAVLSRELVLEGLTARRKRSLIYCPVCAAQRKMMRYKNGWRCLQCENRFITPTGLQKDFELMPDEN